MKKALISLGLAGVLTSCITPPPKREDFIEEEYSKWAKKYSLTQCTGTAKIDDSSNQYQIWEAYVKAHLDYEKQCMPCEYFLFDTLFKDDDNKELIVVYCDQISVGVHK